MTRYRLGDARECVTQGVLTLPLTDTDDGDVVLAYTDDVHQTDYLDGMAQLHPRVALAHREVLPSPAGESSTRVRYTAPGVVRDRGDRDTWWESVPEELGRLDADAHTATLGDRARDGLAIRDGFVRRLDTPPIAGLKDACDRWSPPLTLALVHDARGMVVTDRGLWFALVPRPTIVPVGYNLAAFLATRPVDPDEAWHEVFRQVAQAHYRRGLLDTLTEPGTRYCVCGREPAEHTPTDEQLDRYLDIAASPRATPTIQS